MRPFVGMPTQKPIPQKLVLKRALPDVAVRSLSVAVRSACWAAGKPTSSPSVGGPNVTQRTVLRCRVANSLKKR